MAKSSFEKAVEINPNNPEVYQKRAMLHYDLEDYESSLEDLTRLLKLIRS